MRQTSPALGAGLYPDLDHAVLRLVLLAFVSRVLKDCIANLESTYLRQKAARMKSLLLSW